MPLTYPPGVLWFDEGVEVLRSDRVSFEGAGVTLTDDGSGGITVTIPGGGGPGASMPVENEGVQITAAATLLNFVGAGVLATASGDDVTVTVPGAVTGLLAGRPAAVADNEGMVYYATDVDLAYISDGSTWTTTIISAAGLTGTTAQFNSALSDGDFATLAGTETLSNKTLTLPQINDTSSDHQYVFAVSELAADRTVTLPLLTAADTFVFESHTQTLANKTLTTPTIASFTNATHTHQNAAGGGQLDHGAALTGLTDDDHTQYARLLGRAGGQTLIGGTASGNSLTLQSTSHATKGFIVLDDAQEWTATNVSMSGSGAVSDWNYVNVDHTLTMGGTMDGSFLGQTFAALRFRPTVIWSNNSNAINAGAVFSNQASMRNDNGSTRTITGMWSFADVVDYKVDGGTLTVAGTSVSFYSRPTFTTAGTGTLDASGEFTGFHSELNIATGTLATRRGMRVMNGSGAGAITTQIGVDIDALTKGTTLNIGIRNASPYVATPSATQTISAVGNTILANAEYVVISNTTGGSLTLTSAPTIANGQAGQIVTITNVGTQNVVIQDQGTLASSNLRLMTTTVVISPRDSVTLMYNATVGDWIQITPLATVI